MTHNSHGFDFKNRKLLNFLSFLIVFVLGSCTSKEVQYSPKTDIQVTANNVFVGANTCKSCHEKEYKSWKGSHHEQAMKVADSSSILGDFDNAKFEHNGVTHKFFMNGSKYMVNTQDGDGTYRDFEILHTFGFSPLQQYMIAFPGGSLQCLQIAWDSETNKWFDLQPDLKVAPEEWLHWTRGAMRWNTMCADCHSTDLHKSYNSQKQSYQTKYSEINVACESCHGPASNHVAHYQENKKERSPALWMSKGRSSKEIVDDCARCHSRRGQITPYFDYTGTFTDHYDPALITDSNYEWDGQIKNEDYVWGSFVQSKMYHNGVSCLDCHDAHTYELKKQGNLLCLQCHETNYDSPSHHYHQQKSEAAQCINCHMTGKTYMGNDFRRDHSFRVPRPDQTVNYGTPNACNSCHQDKSAKWASDVVIENYGKQRAKHFSDLLLAGHEGNQAALLELVSDTSYPAIARATAVRYASNTLTRESFEAMRAYLSDSSDLVRREVTQMVTQVTQGELSNEISLRLSDESRLVRIAAARFFDHPNAKSSDPTALARAKKEYLASLQMQADFPGGQHALAMYYESQGQHQQAIAAYQKALKIDNYYNQARMNLAMLYYQQGEPDKAASLYLKVVQQEPDYSQSYYMLGLLYHEQGKREKALEYLELACNKLPRHDRAFYNFALLLQQDNQLTQSIAIIDEANLSFPNHEELQYLKLLAQVKRKKKKEALLTLDLLLRLSPNNQQYIQIKNDLTRQP